ncbi:MAG: T9SS type A sorting domain-containing protein [Ignavibacteria bacterium]|nr:T9SS type A sorting domain-containing protein [Ignavibacteria bacterium]
MKNKTLLFFILIFFISANVLTGDRYQTKIDRNQRLNDGGSFSLIPYNTLPQSVVFMPQLAQGFSTDSITVGNEILTGISGFYDYKTNGETNEYIQVDPSNPDVIHVIDVQSDSLDAAGSTTRKTRYSFSTDGGNTWETSTIEVPLVRSGFGVLQLTTDGAAVISNHNTNSGNVIDANLYIDVAPLAGTFNEYSHASHSPFGIWPQISVYNNGNVGLISRRNVSSTDPPETLFYSYYNGSSMSTRTPLWLTGMTFNGTVGSNMRYHIANNKQGRVTVVIAPVNENDTLENSKMFQITSTDNGATWGTASTVFAPYTINSGQDTVATAGGSYLLYKKNTNNWYLAYPVTADNLFANGELKLTKSDGNTLTTTTICNVNDVQATTTYSQSLAFVFNIDFPAMAFSEDGSTLYCVYSVVKSDTSNGGFNQRDLYMQYSLTDGATWSTPLRLTNTPTIDESYPSVSLYNKGSNGSAYELNLVYMKDPGVGPASFNGNGTLAAPSRNFQVYRKLTGTSPIGIENNQNNLTDWHLGQNYPNPFNPTTKIEYNLKKTGFVSLKVYDILGREVANLINDIQTAGVKSIEFDGTNLPSGIYIYKLKAGDFSDTKKMILVK